MDDFLLNGDSQAGTSSQNHHMNMNDQNYSRDQNFANSPRESTRNSYGTPHAGASAGAGSPFPSRNRSGAKPPRGSVMSSTRKVGLPNSMSPRSPRAPGSSHHVHFIQTPNANIANNTNSVGASTRQSTRNTPFTLNTPGSINSNHSGMSGMSGMNMNTPRAYENQDNYFPSSAGGGSSGGSNRHNSSSYNSNHMALAANNSNSSELSNPSMDQIYQYWCIIIGFSPDNHRTNKIINIFNNRNSIQYVKESTNNWVLVKFSNPNEAIIAVNAHDQTFVNSDGNGSCSDNGTFLVVNQLNMKIAQKMNINMNSHGELVSVGGGATADNTTTYSAPDAGAAVVSSSESESGSKLAPTVSTAGMRRRGASPGRYQRQTSGLKITTVSGNEVDPSAYLKPVRRKSICDTLMSWFGFD